MFGHPTRNAFALVSPSGRFLNNRTYSCVVTRQTPLPQILKHETSNGNAKRQKGDAATKRPSHIDRAGLRENTFQHKFSNSVSPIFNAGDLRASIERRDDECTIVISIREEIYVGRPIHQGADCFPISRSSIDLDCRTMISVLVRKRDCQFQRWYHHLYTKQQSLDIWLVF